MTGVPKVRLPNLGDASTGRLLRLLRKEVQLGVGSVIAKLSTGYVSGRDTGRTDENERQMKSFAPGERPGRKA